MVTGRIHLKIAVINKGQIRQTECVAKGFSTIRITYGSTAVPNVCPAPRKLLQKNPHMVSSQKVYQIGQW